MNNILHALQKYIFLYTLNSQNGTSQPAFVHSFLYSPTRLIGIIKCSDDMSTLLLERRRLKLPKEIIPLSRSMLTPPRPWKNLKEGPFFIYNERLMRFENYSSQVKPLARSME